MFLQGSPIVTMVLFSRMSRRCLTLVFTKFAFFQVVLLIATAGLLGAGSYGLTGLKQDFDFNLFLPPDSDATKYNTISSKVGIHTAMGFLKVANAESMLRNSEENPVDSHVRSYSGVPFHVLFSFLPRDY